MPNVERKDEWSDRLEDYIEVVDKYYGLLLDSLSQTDGTEDALYRDILVRRQYFELFSLNDVVNDPTLSRRLNSSNYINIDNLKNRYLDHVISLFFHKNFMSNKDLTLTEAYDEGFIQYPKEMRRFFKTQALQSMIIKKHDRDIILTYVERYEKEYGTVTPLEPILEEIEYGTVADHDLILQDQLGKELKWEALRQQWKGKFIYVDFWASWCAPCIRAIPFSKVLQKQLKNQDVVFVYLALNDEKKAWTVMSEKQQLGENNYLIINSRSSRFISQTGLDAIPRYMIYDRNGKLIH
jgi:thiol-disulfide isomerase/thioredoxin